MITAENVRDLYRQMQQSGQTTGNEAVYLRPELKTILFGEQTHLDVDSFSLPIIADSAIEEVSVGTRFESIVYILDQEAFAEAACDLLV